MPLVFKLTKAPGLTRRVQFPDTPSWHDLAHRIEQQFAVPLHNVAVSYTDEDGDVVTLSSQQELDDFLQVHPQGRPIRFAVQDLSQPAQNFPPPPSSVSMTDDRDDIRTIRSTSTAPSRTGDRSERTRHSSSAASDLAFDNLMGGEVYRAPGPYEGPHDHRGRGFGRGGHHGPWGPPHWRDYYGYGPPPHPHHHHGPHGWKRHCGPPHHWRHHHFHPYGPPPPPYGWGPPPHHHGPPHHGPPPPPPHHGWPPPPPPPPPAAPSSEEWQAYYGPPRPRSRSRSPKREHASPAMPPAEPAPDALRSPRPQHERARETRSRARSHSPVPGPSRHRSRSPAREVRSHHRTSPPPQPSPYSQPPQHPHFPYPPPPPHWGRPPGPPPHHWGPPPGPPPY